MQLGDFTRMGLLALRSLCLNLIPCTSSIRHRKKYLNQTTSRSDGQIEIYLKKKEKGHAALPKRKGKSSSLGCPFPQKGSMQEGG